MAIEKRMSITLLASWAAVLVSVSFFGLEFDSYVDSGVISIATALVMAAAGMFLSAFAVWAKKKTSRGSMYKLAEVLGVALMLCWSVFVWTVGVKGTVYVASSAFVRVLLIFIALVMYFSYYLLTYRNGSRSVRYRTTETDRYGIPL